MSQTVTRQALLSECNELLQPARFKDYGPNGLQVEGAENIRHIVSGVTASRALIEAAIDAKADAIFVHHGLFWRGQDGTVTGWMKQRLQFRAVGRTCRWPSICRCTRIGCHGVYSFATRTRGGANACA